ncbi:MAG: 50S ribosomal protein L15 [Candidatus Omnitrophota bacterium]
MKKIIPAIRKKSEVKNKSKRTIRKIAPLKNKEEAALVRWSGLHNLSAPVGANRGKRILGRGPSSGHGKTSTRGSKGQTSRAGRDFYPGFEGGQTPLIRRIPKRGFTSKRKKQFQIVNLKDLSRVKETLLTLQVLKDHNLISNKDKLVKILGEGQINNPLTVQAHAFSRRAAEQIESAGGKIEILLHNAKVKKKTS